MNDYTTQDIRKAYERLPESLQDAVASTDIDNLVQEIGKSFNLHIDQVGALAEETGLVLLGFAHPREFVGNIQRRLKISSEEAQKIGGAIDDEIFTQVREGLRSLHEETPADHTTSMENTTSIDSLDTHTLPQEAQEVVATTPEEEPLPDKDELLREIEGDNVNSEVVTRVPKTPVAQNAPAPEPSSVQKEGMSTPSTAPEKSVVNEKMPNDDNFVGKKLSQPIQNAPAIGHNKSDPYRETIEPEDLGIIDEMK